MRSCSAVTIAAALTLAAGAKATDTPSWTATVRRPRSMESRVNHDY